MYATWLSNQLTLNVNTSGKGDLMQRVYCVCLYLHFGPDYDWEEPFEPTAYLTPPSLGYTSEEPPPISHLPSVLSWIALHKWINLLTVSSSSHFLYFLPFFFCACSICPCLSITSCAFTIYMKLFWWYSWTGFFSGEHGQLLTSKTFWNIF